MWRWTMRMFVVLGAFIIVAALSGATYQWIATRKQLAATPPPGHLVDIGGYRLHLWCTGDGAPAVILDTGLGGSSAGWGYVQPEVARFTRVCSYDRAGMGYSDPGPSPRTARRIASELAELLVRSGITGPVVLVGASIAGFDVRVFASDHAERAAGLVLVDASHEDDAHEVPRMARFVPLLSTIGVLRLLGVSFGEGVESLAPSVRRFAQATRFRAAGYQAAADEIIHIRESVEEVRSSRRKLTIPVFVVTGARGADENWRRLQQDQASLSERGCLVIAPQSGHVVQVDQPEVVVDAIRTVVETARKHDVRPCATSDVGRLPETAPPRGVSNCDDSLLTWSRCVGRVERPTDGRSHAEHGEIIPRHQSFLDGSAIHSGEYRAERCDVREDFPLRREPRVWCNHGDAIRKRWRVACESGRGPSTS
jgi:pimeloyl-ACP methyl ester carboxylesterase